MLLNNYSLKLYKIKDHFSKSFLIFFFTEYPSIKNHKESLLFTFSNKTVKQFFNLTIYKNLNVIINSYVAYSTTFYDSSLKKNNLYLIFNSKYYATLQLNKLKSIDYKKNIKSLYSVLKKLSSYKILQITSYKCF